MTKLHYGSRIIAFRQAFAGIVAYAGMVEVSRFGKSENGLELAVDVGGFQQIVTAGDVGDVLEGVVNDYGEVVCDADVFSGEDGIAIGVGVHAGFSEAEIFEAEPAMNCGGFVGI